jgi:hypothetical protein
MKRLLQLTAVLLLSLSLAAQTHEILRPTADSDSSSLCGPNVAVGAVNLASVAMPNAYDASGTSTNSTVGVNASTTNQQYKGRHFTGFPNPSGAYSSVTINVNAACLQSIGDCFIGVSLDGGTTVATTLLSTTHTSAAQQTFTASLSTSQSFSQIQVSVCALADPTSGTASTQVFDIWTDGVIATIPSAPSGLSASVSNGVVNLSWTDNSTNETGFKIDQCVGTTAVCTSDSVATLKLTTGANAASQGIGALAGKTSYTFWVKSTNVAGDSAAVGPVTVFLPGASVHHITSP